MGERRDYNQTDLGSNSNYAIKSLYLLKGLIQMSLDLLAYKLEILILIF